jgi:D-beta-D-heptose 7-phosphate kinase/D-beta-D-heptose 1-phosphate adenosyltransferase
VRPHPNQPFAAKSPDRNDPGVTTVNHSSLQSAIAAFRSTAVLIVGDVMLDQFVVGRVNRISPEAPVPVVEYEHDEYRIGGASNVASNVRALGGSVELVGLTGCDGANERLRRLLAHQGVGTSGLVADQTRRTTTKLRIVTNRNQQVARVDYESDVEARGEVEDALGAQVERLAAGAHVIVVSDYLKGTVTHALMLRVVEAGRARGIPVLVDPKIPHIGYYAGTTIVTPNHHEAETATHRRIRSHEDAVDAGRLFRERARCERVLITRGEHGMCLLDGEHAEHFPAVAREVSDVTGAGDTVIATLGLGLAAGASLRDACILANHAAGIVVGKFGPATVTPQELSEELARG